MSKWIATETLLIVGEGQSEVAFLSHIKQLFSTRRDGKQIKIKNAQGGGASHVVDWTVRQKLNADYDVVAAVSDTDTACWTDKVRSYAKQHNIKLLTSEPCLEAMLLRVLGQSDDGVSHALKKRFAPFVNKDSTIASNYEKYFTKKLLSKTKEKSIQELLKLICLHFTESAPVKCMPQK